MVRACSPSRLPLSPHRGPGGHGRYQARGLSIWAPRRGRSLLEGRLVCRDGQQGRQGRADHVL